MHPIILRSLIGASGGGAPAYNPVTALFGAGEKGVLYDPSNIASLFQDSAGTVPVTATGQPVGRQLDLSGNGVHRIQPTAAKKPLWQQDGAGKFYLASDGVDDSMYTESALDLSASATCTVLSAFVKVDDAMSGHIIEFSPSVSSNQGAFDLYVSGVSLALRILWRGSGGFNQIASSYSASPSIAGQLKLLMAVVYDLAGATVQMVAPTKRINGQDRAFPTESYTNLGGGNFGSHTCYFMARADSSLFFYGRDYGTIIRSGSTTGTALTNAEGWLNGKIGAY